MNPYFQPNKDFCAGSTEHVVAVLLVTCLCLIATQLAKKSTPEKQDQITKGFAWALVFNVLIWQVVKSYVSFLPENDPAYVKYNWGEDLPLNPCNWLAFVALAYSYTKKEWLWPIMYFFVWVFTFNAIITPAEFPEDFEATMIGTGPMKMEKYTPKVGASFVRNTDYWGAQALPDSPVRPIFISLGLTTVEILRSGITPLRKIVAVHIG